MTTTTRSRIRLWILWALVVAVAAIGGVLIATNLLGGSSAKDESIPAAASSDRGPAFVPASGTARLREGARQVTDPGTARRVADDALARIDAELAAATAPVEVERLQRKRTLIEEAMNRLAAEQK